MFDTSLFTDSFKNALTQGNNEFLKNVDKSLLQDLATNGQNPKAIILSCSDSRVIPEYIFNAKIGDFFVIRVAGGIIDDVIMNSIEYGIKHLGISDIIMLGHTKCGAIQAAIDKKEDNILINKIRPAIEIAIQKSSEEYDLLTSSTLESTRIMFEEINKLDIIKFKDIKVHYTLYDIDSGKISFFE
ncbi:MAG TPA: carbonic anhydrase [Rickettsiales bacterium]|nr:carbonic anhydrase [Rickettsiales bacterium]